MLTTETDGVIPQVQQPPALQFQQPASRMRMPLMPSVQQRTLIPVRFAFPIQQQSDLQILAQLLYFPKKPRSKELGKESMFQRPHPDDKYPYRKMSAAFKMITDRNYFAPKRTEIVKVCEILERHLESKDRDGIERLNRFHKRRKGPAFAWLDRNLDKIDPIVFDAAISQVLRQNLGHSRNDGQ
jgi:hypothetical protein